MARLQEKLQDGGDWAGETIKAVPHCPDPAGLFFSTTVLDSELHPEQG